MQNGSTDTHLLSQKGRLAIHCAACADDVRVFRTLVEEFGVDIAQPDSGRDSRTPLQWAIASRSSSSVAQYILSVARERKKEGRDPQDVVKVCVSIDQFIPPCTHTHQGKPVAKPPPFSGQIGGGVFERI